MTLSTVCIYAGGVLSLFMGIFHTRFYHLFKWGAAFEKIAVPNARIIYTVHLALLLLFFIFAALSLLYAGELSRSSGIAFGLNLGYALFWVWRLVWQIYYFRDFKGTLHYLLIVYFLLLALCYLLPAVSSMKS